MTMPVTNNALEQLVIDSNLYDSEEEFTTDDEKPDYNNYMRLDVGLWSEDVRVVKLINQLCRNMDYRLDVGKKNMAVILLNLYKCRHLDPDKWIAYSRRAGNYKSIFRYNQHNVSYRPLVRIVDYLESEKFIDAKLGFRDKVTKVTRLSRMKASNKLAELFQIHNFTPNLINGPRYNDVVVLKGLDGKEKIYTDSTLNGSLKKRKIIQQYNGLLKRTYIDLDTEGYLPKKCIHVDMSRKHVYRIFSNGKWNNGGRYYGGFWMGIPESLRTRIIINNMEVMEYDFKGMHIKLLYAMEGKPYELGDPYNIPGYPQGKKMRKFLKTLFLILINCEDGRKVKGALEKEIYKDPESFPEFSEWPNLKETVKLIRQHHAPVARHILTGKGIELQYIDSLIAEQVISTFTSRNIPILSIHDSFIIQRCHEDLLTSIMRDAYRSHGNLEINDIVVFKYSERDTHVKDKPAYVYDIDKIKNEDLKLRMMSHAKLNEIPDCNYQLNLHSSKCECRATNNT